MDQEKENRQQAERSRELAQRIMRELTPAGVQVAIGGDGQVSVKIKGQAESQVIGQFTLTDFVNPGGLQPIGENLYAETQSSGAALQGVAGADGLGVIKQGMLEASNVNVTEELVNLIQAQRVYEMNSKVLTTVDQMMSFLTQRT